MRQLFLLIFLLFSISVFGQAPTKVPFGGTRPQDTAWAARSLRIDSAVQFLKYATTDSNMVLGIDDAGRILLRNKGAGTAIDTASLSNRINARVKYSDTAVMLAPYARSGSTMQYSDTASLSNRINARVKYSDTIASIATISYVNGLVGSGVLNHVSARTSLPYSSAINTVNGINLQDSGDITLKPDLNNPQIGATTSLTVIGDGIHNVYAPSYVIEEGSNFKNLVNGKYLFESTYDGVRYYGKFTPLYDTQSCKSFQHPVSGKKAIFFGDSYTVGFGVTTSYAAKYAAFAGETLVNNAIGGTSMQPSTLAIYFNIYTIPKYDTSMGYLFIAFGVNDYLRSSSGLLGFNISGFRYAYMNALNYAVSQGWSTEKIVLITPFYCPYVGTYIEERYARVVRELATSYGTIMFDAFLMMRDFPGINSLYQGDQVHPVQSVHDSLASWLYNADFRTQTQKLCRKNWAAAANGGVASSASGVTPQNAINGVRYTKGLYDTTSGGGAWISDSIMPAAIQFDFASPKKISEVNIFTIPDGGINWYSSPNYETISTNFSISAFTVEHWNGTSWVTDATVTGNNKARRNFKFPEITTSRMRVNVTAVGNINTTAPIVEFEAFGDDVSTVYPPPLTNKPYALQSAVDDSLIGIQGKIDDLGNTRLTRGGDTATKPLEVGTTSNQPLYLKANGASKLVVTADGKVVVNKVLSSGKAFEVFGAALADTVLTTVFGSTRFDINTGEANFAVPALGTYLPLKPIRTGVGLGALYLGSLNRNFRSYDPVQGWEYNQPAASDSVYWHDYTRNMPSMRSYTAEIALVASPNEPMMEIEVTPNNSGVPQIKVLSPNGKITPAVISNKVVLSRASGQLNVSIKPHPDRSGIYFSRLSYFVMRDSLHNWSGIGNMVSFHNTTGVTVIGATGTPTPASGAALDLQANNAYFYPNRMTAAQQATSPAPALGATYFCTDCTATDLSIGVMRTWNGTAWKNNW